MHDCTLCAEPQTMANSVALPCCHQRIHYRCLVHSVHACGDGCPFCTRDLLPFLTDPVVATSLAHHNLSLDLQRAPSNSLVNSLHGPNLPPEPDIWPLCCFRTGGPPDFAPVDDRRMEWSPLQPTAQGRSSEWTPQWICRSCGCSTSMDDIPTMDMVSCPTCSSAPGVVFDRPTGRAVRFCVPCRREVNLSSPSHPPLPHDPPPPPHDSSPAPQPSATPPPTRNWFTHGPLSRFSPLYGWGSAPPTPPGSGSQSWLFCPLISLGLALAESQLGVPPYSTGSRDQVPFDQSLFWTTHANPIIQAFAAHFSSLDRDQPAARMLQSWERGHLSSSAQEHVTPSHIASMLTVWLSEIVSSFEPPLSPQPQDSSVSPPAPSSSTSPSPFQRTTATNNQATPHDPICVSHPFDQTHIPQAPRPPLPLDGLRNVVPEAGPVRLTRFLEMPRDHFYSTLSGPIVAGRFNHIGNASVRLEAQTAWGVWLRIDQWRRGSGGRTQLRCGVLYHVANRELTFHGMADVVTQLLLPIFEDWTYPSITQQPSVRPLTPQAPPLDDPFQQDPFDRQLTGPLPQVPSPTRPSAPPNPPSQGVPVVPPPPPPSPPAADVRALHSIISSLVNVCRANQDAIRTLVDEVRSLRLQAQQAPSPHACPPPLAPPLRPTPLHQPNAEIPPSGGRLPPVRSCRRGGCSVPPHQCRVGYCVDHCTSARCTRNHRPSVRPPPHQQTPTPQHPTTRNRASRVDAVHNPSPQGAAAPGPSASGRPPLVARAPPVGIPPAPLPPPNPPPVPRPCRRRGCLEPVHFECSTGFCNLHCGSRRCSFHNYSSGNGRGAALWSSTP